MDIYKPFGPSIGKIRLPDELIFYLNNEFSDKAPVHTGFLKEKASEIDFSSEVQNKVVTALLSPIAHYHLEHHPEDKDEKLAVICHKGWYVRQFDNEYVPAHVHPNCKLSCVGYLKLPEGIEEEFEKDEKTISPRSARIEFLYGDASMTYCTYSHVIKPKVGDFYIFPSGLLHTVYPFKTRGERRAFSMNLSVGINAEIVSTND